MLVTDVFARRIIGVEPACLSGVSVSRMLNPARAPTTTRCFDSTAASPTWAPSRSRRSSRFGVSISIARFLPTRSTGAEVGGVPKRSKNLDCSHQQRFRGPSSTNSNQVCVTDALPAREASQLSNAQGRALSLMTRVPVYWSRKADSPRCAQRYQVLQQAQATLQTSRKLVWTNASPTPYLAYFLLSLVLVEKLLELLLSRCVRCRFDDLRQCHRVGGF